jgi:hypothetical protein
MGLGEFSKFQGFKVSGAKDARAGLQEPGARETECFPNFRIAKKRVKTGVFGLPISSFESVSCEELSR